MTAFLQRGDRILLAAPDFRPVNSPATDRDYWNSVFEPFGVEVHHVSIMDGLTYPVVVAVFRPGVEVVVEHNASPF